MKHCTAEGIDLDNDNGALMYVRAARLAGRLLSPNGSDLPTILQFAVNLLIAMFDAIAPYHDTAIGIVTKLPRRPLSERTLRNMNIACIYAGHRVNTMLYPFDKATLDQILVDFGLDPNDIDANMNTPSGIGNIVGPAVVHERIRDGLNHFGDEFGCKYNCFGYMDYTNYEPTNTPYKLKDPAKWQPEIMPVQGAYGKFTVQQFLARETFSNRIEEGDPIYLHEFFSSYPF